MRRKLRKHESPVRKMVSEANKLDYKHLKNLSEAQKYNDAYMIMEGDYGGQIYLSIPAKLVKSDINTLKLLLRDLDHLSWDDPEGAKIYFERKKEPEVIAGGMGGGTLSKDLWVHHSFKNIKNKIKLVLQGKIATIAQKVIGDKKWINKKY